jgi:hypothetical protein
LMRQAGLFQVYEGVDYGILWPLAVTGRYAPTNGIRGWILDLLNNWPREIIMVEMVKHKF